MNEVSDETLDEYTGKASTGAAWTLVGYGGRQLIRLASNLALTRLLLPEHFGLMFIVSGVLIGLELFSDIGLGHAIIQSPRNDSGFLNTAWSLNVLRGVVLWVIASVLGPVCALAYDEPMLLVLLPVAGLVAFFEGFRSTRFFTHNRELDIKRIIVLEVVAQVAGVVVMITWALLSPTIWALMAGNIVVAFVGTVLSWVWLKGISNRFQFDRAAAAALISFGAWIFLSSALTFSADYMDRFLFRFFVSNAVLGVYSIGVTLAALPGQSMNHLMQSIVFPLYSRVLTAAEDRSSRYRAVRAPLLTLAGWATAGLLAGGPTIVELLYDARYLEAGWMLQAISAGMWFGIVLAGSNGAAVLALGRSNWTAGISFGRLIGIAVLVPFGWWVAEFPGLVLGFAASELLRYAVSLVGVGLLGLDGRRQDAAMTLVVAASAALGWGAVQGVRRLGWDHVVLDAVVIFVVVTVAWLPWHLRLARRLRRGEKLFAPEPIP